MLDVWYACCMAIVIKTWRMLDVSSSLPELQSISRGGDDDGDDDDDDAPGFSCGLVWKWGTVCPKVATVIWEVKINHQILGTLFWDRLMCILPCFWFCSLVCGSTNKWFMTILTAENAVTEDFVFISVHDRFHERRHRLENSGPFPRHAGGNSGSPAWIRNLTPGCS